MQFIRCASTVTKIKVIVHCSFFFIYIYPHLFSYTKASETPVAREAERNTVNCFFLHILTDEMK